LYASGRQLAIAVFTSGFNRVCGGKGMLMPLQDRTVLVTGASRGIGWAVAGALLRAGARVIAVSRDSESLREGAEELRGLLGEAAVPESGAEPARESRLLTMPADVGDPAQVKRLFREVRARVPRLDALINAAGVLQRGRLEEITIDQWEESLRVNLTGVFLCSQAAVRLMLAQPPLAGGGRGHIVQIVSGAGVHGWVGAGAYTASKFGVMGLSEVLRDEVRERGIKVTTVLPGMVQTTMTDHPDFAQRHKLEADDVARAVLTVLETSPEAMITRIDVRHRLPL
jgi:NAD(P)-dependent dehydrogenase (short-subunit alcohol dehydrogenase family)